MTDDATRGITRARRTDGQHSVSVLSVVGVTTDSGARLRADEVPNFRVLGPLVAHAHAHDTELDIGGPKERAVLATLLAAEGRVVSIDALLDAVWPERPPRSAARTVQSYVARLRRSFAGASGAAVLATHGKGYLLEVPRTCVDALRFEDAAARGAALLHRNDAVGALAAFDAALAEWRGDPYHGFEDIERCAAAARSLVELCDVVAESRFDALLALGACTEILPSLTAAAEEAPLRERRWGQLIVALYRSDRQADALRAYRRARSVLVDELGVEPSQALRELEAAVLAQDDQILRGDERQEPLLTLPAALALDDSLMVGRDPELDRLGELWAATRRGTNGLVSIVGVEGAGKTRLAAELASTVHAEGGVVAFGRCDVDHHTARTLLDQALRSAGGSLMRAQSDGDPGESLGTSVARRLSSWASRYPVLVVLDDLHAAEAEVLDVVAEVSASIDGPVLIVLVFRTDTADAVGRDGLEMGVLLGGLDAAATARICSLYGDAWSTVDVDRILQTTAGIPLSIHQQAMAEAQAGAAHRLEEAAHEAQAAGFRLSTSRQAVAEEVAGLQRVADQRRRQLASRAADKRRADCPFRGLMPFQIEDADWFFGRERTVADVVSRLVSQPTLLVVGASGSGKSSLVRAGVVPAMTDGVLAGGDTWRPVLLTPGGQPVVALDTALASALADPQTIGRTLVVVDQLEELFTLCRSADEREAFASALAELIDGGGRLIAVIRADQIEGVAQVPTLAGLLGGRGVLVGPLSEVELLAAIVRPAERAGLSFEDGLVDEILDDARGAPGALPFVQTALLETWNRRRGDTLTLDGYRKSGGVRGAIARMAEEMYATLTVPQQQAAWRMLLRLADAGSDGTLDLRRRVAVTDLARADDADAWAAFDRMVRQRLLTVSGGDVEVTHETLFREWPRLRGWLTDDVAGRALHQRLGDSARNWESGGRDPSELLRGSRLVAADEWARQHATELNDAERALLEASRAEQARELSEAVTRADREARASRRLRKLLAVVAVLLVLAVLAGAVAAWERTRSRQAEHEALRAGEIADAGRLAAKAIVDQRLDHAMLTAVAALSLADTPETRAGLLSVLQRAPFALGIARLPNMGRPQAISLSPDGSLLAVSDAAMQIYLFDSATWNIAVASPMPATGDSHFFPTAGWRTRWRTERPGSRSWIRSSRRRRCAC